MNLIYNELIGSGYFFLNARGNLTFIDKNYKHVAKKITKRKYKSLTEPQLHDILKRHFTKFLESIKDTTIAFLNTDEVVTNIVRLWYDNGFCKYIIFNNGKLEKYATNAQIVVNSSAKEINYYPTLEAVSYFAFGDVTVDNKQIFDIEKMCQLYGEH